MQEEGLFFPFILKEKEQPFLFHTICGIHFLQVKPTMFKTLVGKGHSEFSTGRQQDALEFLQHIFTLIERNVRSRGEPVDPSQVRFIQTKN